MDTKQSSSIIALFVVVFSYNQLSIHYLQNISNTTVGHAVTPYPSYDYPTRLSTFNILLGLAKYLMIITGFTYASWRLLRSYVLPRFFNVSEPFEQRIHAIEGKVGFIAYIFRFILSRLF